MKKTIPVIGNNRIYLRVSEQFLQAICFPFLFASGGPESAIKEPISIK